MSNPIDDLPFDVNSLRANDEFNWDCVDGIDQVHKDILTQYERIITTLITPLKKAEANVNAIGVNIANNAVTGLPSVATSIDHVDSGIVNSLNTKMAPLTTIYGNPSSVEVYYWVWRQVGTNTWYPRLEHRVNPADTTSYGPYSSGCALLYALNDAGLCHGQKYPTMPQYDQSIKDRIDSFYSIRIITYPVGSDCDPIMICGIPIVEAIEVVPSPVVPPIVTSPPPPIILPSPTIPPAKCADDTIGAIPYLRLLWYQSASKEGFACHTWCLPDDGLYPVGDGQLPTKILSPTGTLVVNELGYVLSYGDWISNRDAYGLQTQLVRSPTWPCDGTAYPPPGIIPTPSPIPPTPNVPVDCCAAIEKGFKDICECISNIKPPNITTGDIDNTVNGLVEEQYLLSEEFETDANAYLSRMASAIGIPLLDSNIVSAIQSSLMLVSVEQKSIEYINATRSN